MTTITMKRYKTKTVNSNQMHKEIEEMKNDKTEIIIFDMNSKEYRKEDSGYIVPLDRLMNDYYDQVTAWTMPEKIILVSHMSNDISYKKATDMINEVIENDYRHEWLCNKLNKHSIKIELVTFKKAKEGVVA